MATSPEMMHRADFTFVNYRRLLQVAKRTWTFRGYSDFRRDERFVLWRHDVDLSVPAAARMALIEHEEGVRATYFVNPHSEYYNLGERTTAALVRTILEQGHDIGLHFDSHFFGIETEAALDDAVRQDAELLERWFGVAVHTFSFHNTTPFVLGCREWQYGGRVNTYAQYFQEDVGYCSDSNGYWRHRRLPDVLHGATDFSLQVLTHDGWWSDEVTSPRACVHQSLVGAARGTFNAYRTHLALHSMRDVGELQRAWDVLSEVDAELAASAEWLFLDGRIELALLELWRAVPGNARTVMANTRAGVAVSRTLNMVLTGNSVARGAVHAAIVACIAALTVQPSVEAIAA